MQISRQDIGYTIYSRMEEAFRSFCAKKIFSFSGNTWIDFIPEGIRQRINPSLTKSEMDDLILLLDETNLPDLMEIICYKKNYSNFINIDLPVEQFREIMGRLYDIRCKIAHVKRNVTSLDLDFLLEISKRFLPVFAGDGIDLKEVLDCISTNPEKVVISIPPDFFIYEEPCSRHLNNLPASDYDPDGGFIGRQDDLKNITNLLLGKVHRVITISGAGGVGKTAIAHQICQNLLYRVALPFDAIVWTSAKEERLTITGIEPIYPTLRNYEALLDSILETFGWADDLEKTLDKKEESIEIISKAGEKGILIVVDNLETVRDERVLDFLKEIPPPNKVLITSRLGLGEVEKRYPLKEMNTKDAITLLRTISREKGAESLSRLPDPLLTGYVNKMSRYPLAIKWVIGQIALGKDINLVIGELTASSGDVAKFCFEQIYNNLDQDSKLVLYSLASSDKQLVRGILSHISNLSPEKLDNALRTLTIASLVIPNLEKTADSFIETRYELLPLTKNYLQAKLSTNTDIFRDIRNRTEMVQALIEEADKAGKQYRYSLKDMGAETEEEKVAATWAITAYQKYQAGDYDGSIESLKRASQIAPHFAGIYRNWATIECEAGFYDKADELMKKATNLDPNDARMWFTWGNIEKRRQRYDKAYGHLEKALKLSPNDPPILGSIGDVEKRRGNFEEADRWLRKALDKAFDLSGKHKMISYTSLADNLQRWGESLIGNKNLDEALRKLKEAYNFACQAVDIDRNDTRAQNSFLEAAEELGMLLLEREGLEKARVYLDSAITEKPKRAKERKINISCCYYLAQALLDVGNVNDAKKYFVLGKKALFQDSKFVDKYKEMNLEFSQERKRGKLIRIVADRAFGFLEIESQTGQLFFLHISNIYPKSSIDEFELMRGSWFSFLVEPGEKGPVAKRARLIME